MKFKKSRLYIFEKNENLIDNLSGRFNRPYTLYRKLLPDIYKHMINYPKLNFKNRFPKITKDIFTQANWSQTAGCRCGCSPGFIMKNFDNYEIFVTIRTRKSYS